MDKPRKADMPVETKSDLVAFLESGCKPRSDWRIGTEHEKFGFRLADNSPLPYDGADGIAAVLTRLGERMEWRPIEEEGKIIGLQCPGGQGTVTLSRGGQLELSGAPLETLHQTCNEVNTHLDHVRAVAGDLEIGFLGAGFSPKWTLAETPRMPKGRYDIMTAYMPKVGGHGLDMMYRTCTVQVKFDYSSEADMVRKLRVSLALQPVCTAIFANSPFTEGAPNGFQSYRAEVWRDTDPDRTGQLPFAFKAGTGFEQYADYALTVPMYFIYRDGKYIDAEGVPFSDFLAGNLAVLPGEKPLMSDWVMHLSTLFPDVRLKNYLEMRGADGSPWRGLCALPALWVGLLYDDPALDAAWQLVKDWSDADRRALRDSVPRHGLAAKRGSQTVQEIADEMVAISRAGLVRRARLNSAGEDESVFLEIVEAIVRSGQTPAGRMLHLFETEWDRDIDRIFVEQAY